MTPHFGTGPTALDVQFKRQSGQVDSVTIAPQEHTGTSICLNVWPVPQDNITVQSRMFVSVLLKRRSCCQMEVVFYVIGQVTGTKGINSA